jgi:hypothetical protein
MKENRVRDERLQIMLSPEELVAVDDFRFKKRMPSRAAAVRELLRRGLAAEGFDLALAVSKSTDFGWLATPQVRCGEAPRGADHHFHFLVECEGGDRAP